MRKFLTFLGATAFFFTAAIIISCEGPAGPQGEVGPAGPTGPAGPQGEQGIAGADGTATCAVCHNDDQTDVNLFARVNQWEASVHATGGNFERNGSSCAPCHTSQGFLDALALGEFAQASPGNGSASGTISNPNPINCYTCHAIHDTYTSADWDFTKTTATKGWFAKDGATFTEVDLGTGNMCTGCHQGRALSAVLDMTDNTTTISPSSYRWGLHHGPQYNIIAGGSLFEFDGTTEYPTSENHITVQTTNGCVDCHMAEPYGTQAGGHTFNMNYLYHGSGHPNFPASCETCHVPDGAMDLIDIYEALEVEIEGLLTDLGTALETAGVRDPGTHYLVHPGGVVTPQTHMMLAAFTNWQAIEEDRSKGFHNPAYVRAILENTLEVAFPTK